LCDKIKDDMKISRQRVKAARSLKSIVTSYLILVAILLTFLGSLYLLAVLENMLIS